MFFLNADPRIGFVIPQVHIVFRLMPFDQIIFQQQRIHFSFHLDGFDIGDLPHHHRRLPRIMLLMKVAADTLSERLCLSYINQPTVLVVELVYTGIIGKNRNYTQVIEHRLTLAKLRMISPKDEIAKALRNYE